MNTNFRLLQMMALSMALLVFSISGPVQAKPRAMSCEGQDSRMRLSFFYDVQIEADVAETKLYLHPAGSEMIVGESRLSKVGDEKFEVQSPYSDLKARIAFERDYWILDLMEMNGNFVIPTYDYFDCIEKF